MSEPYDFLKRLPDATITQPFEKHPGVFIRAALVEGQGRSVFIERIDGPAVPAPVYTINIGGRGSIVGSEQDFRDVLSSALLLFEVISPGFVAPTLPEAGSALPDISGLTKG